MANDRIVVATVAFAVPAHLVDKINHPDTLYNVEMMIPIENNALRAIVLNKCYATIEAIMNADNPDTDLVDFEDVPLVRQVEDLYKKNSEFPHTEILHNNF